MRVGLAYSVWSLVQGVLRRFLFCLPFILLDATDYWERYLQPFIKTLTGRDLVMPGDGLITLGLLGAAWAAVLTYHELRSQKLKLDEELTPAITIDPNPILQEWTSQSGSFRAFYFAVKNPSAKVLRGVGAYLTRIDPPVSQLNWLPVPLHIKHDNTTPHRESFSMNPQGMRHVDLVTQLSGQELAIDHIVPGVSKTLSVATYVLTVRVEGENVTLPQEAKFLIKVDHKGLLRCLPGSFVDLDKGLWEFHKDYQDALPLLTSSFTQMTQAAGPVTEAMQSARDAVTRATSTPVTWTERLLGVKTSLDRLLRWSPGLAKRLDFATAELEYNVEIYRMRANELIKNFTGYAELATVIADKEIEGIRKVRDSTADALQSTKGWRASVAGIEASRLSTHHFTRAMRRLRIVLDGNIEATEGILDAFDSAIALARDKAKADE